MQGVPGGRPPPISLSAGGGVERQGSNDPPQFMRALADMHCGTSPQQKMMQEPKRNPSVLCEAATVLITMDTICSFLANRDVCTS